MKSLEPLREVDRAMQKDINELKEMSTAKLDIVTEAIKTKVWLTSPSLTIRCVLIS